jgi:hypothetical protein
MIKLIIIAFVLIVLFLSRNFWAEKIGNIVRNRRERKKKVNTLDNVGIKAIFSPLGTKRTFLIALEIEEMGDGQVDITLAKIKQPEI